MDDEEQVRAERKAVIKEAIDEWVKETYSTFGRWSAIGIGIAALGVLGYFIITFQGWHK